MSLKPSMHPTQFMFSKLKLAEVRQAELRGGLIKLPIFLLAPCCCRLFVQMEEEEGALEFRASAGDLLRGESEKEVGLRNVQHESRVLWHTEVHAWSIDPKRVQYFWSVMLSGPFFSIAGGARIWHHKDLSAEKQLRNAPTLQTRGSASFCSSQTAASSPDQHLQQPAHWWQQVSGAAATTQHAGETRLLYSGQRLL